MIRTLTLNPAIDKSVTIDRFTLDQVNRISSVRLHAGGKGLNVARVLGILGAPVLAVAPVAGDAGRFLAGRLAAEGVPFAGVDIAGETRTNLKIADPSSGTHTDINEPGPVLPAEAVSALKDKVLGGLGPGDWAVFSGSVPPGVSPGLYGQWIAEARKAGVRTVLDAHGEALDLGLAAGPELIKPNQEELEAWVGYAVESEDRLFSAVAALRRAGAQTVAVSQGAKGAWLFLDDQAWYAPGLALEVRSTVGAGDALVAGLVWGLSQNLPAQEALSLAAAAAASAVSRGDRAGSLQEIEAFRSRISPRCQPFPRS